MYIQESKVTSSIPVYSETGELISWEVSPEIELELMRLMPFVILEFEGEGEDKRVIGVKDDAEARAAYLAAKEPTAEQKITDAMAAVRRERRKLLQAFDVYKSNLYYGVIEETEDEHDDILAWYQAILDLPEAVSKVNLEVAWPDVPEKIKRYL